MSQASDGAKVIAMIRRVEAECDGDHAAVLANLTCGLATVAIVNGFELSYVLRVVSKTYRDALARIPAHARGEGARDDVN